MLNVDSAGTEITTSEISEAEIRGAIIRLKNGKKCWNRFHQCRNAQMYTNVHKELRVLFDKIVNLCR